ncbi:MAG: Fic family protein [Nitrospirota bacterium]
MAGKYRQVNIGKGGFHFAAAQYIPTLMSEFERGPLRHLTPCTFSSPEDIIHALAVVHVELVLIHPFREGNGRLARLVAAVMALQAGLPPLDFGAIHGSKRTAYFRAVRAGMVRDYELMEKIFSAVVRRTLRLHGKQQRG